MMKWNRCSTNLQCDIHISSLEELDFEDETKISNSEEELNITRGSIIDTHELERTYQAESKLGNTKYEEKLKDLEDGEISDNSLNQKEACISLSEELVFDVKDAMFVDKIIPSSSKVNIIDVKEFKELHQSESEGGKIKNEEELNDLEEGEISESSNIKKNGKSVCRYFKCGTCFYGSHCQFLHVSNSVYNMFNPTNSYKGNLKVTEPYFSLPEIENPAHLVQNNKTAWENGLENAKAMVQKAICKRIDDKDFENKKLYISNSFISDLSQVKDSGLETNVKSTSDVSLNIEPVKTNSVRFVHKTMKQKQSIATSNCFNVKKSNCEYICVDPWMRSRSSRKKKQYKSHSSLKHSRKEFNRALSSSSSSSIERIYRGSEDRKFYKKISPTRKFNIKQHKSYSRRFFRSSSRSCSRKRCQSRSPSWSRSPCERKTYKRKRSTSLEKWFEHQHDTASDSRSSSHSSVLSFRRSTHKTSLKGNSDTGSWSSMTVSCITCSYSSSDSPKSQNELSKSSIKKEFSNSSSFAIPQNAKETNKLQSSKSSLSDNCVKGKSLSGHSNISASKKRGSVASYKSTFAEESNTCVTECPLLRVSKHSASQLVTPKPVSQLLTKPTSLKSISKDQSIADCYASNHNAVSKPISSVINSVSSQALDSINSSQVPGNKRTSSHLFKQTITLNLQPKSQRYPKLTEAVYKKQNLPGTINNLNKRSLSKRETLLKQLKLVEDAISRKKRCQ